MKIRLLITDIAADYAVISRLIGSLVPIQICPKYCNTVLKKVKIQNFKNDI